jgi:hypothetical protein
MRPCRERKIFNFPLPAASSRSGNRNDFRRGFARWQSALGEISSKFRYVKIGTIFEGASEASGFVVCPRWEFIQSGKMKKPKNFATVLLTY